MKGIILAGGSGSRLYPITIPTSKQLLPVYDKPMIYYPLSVLMLAGITDILIITTPPDRPIFERLLGDGSWIGIELSYAEQAKPSGLAEAFIIGASHIGEDSAALILGDNIFHGPGFAQVLRDRKHHIEGCTLFGYPVSDPHRYGVGEADDDGRLISIEEKPAQPRSNRAITGLYYYDNDVIDIAKQLEPSDRGELEITDINRVYLEREKAHIVDLGRGFAWMDAGTHQSLLEASQYVHTLEERQGVRIACLEEIAFRMGFIGAEDCYSLGRRLANSRYGQYVMEIAQSEGK
ncbi:glucose-1-phosphate thymidylyltransferase [Actinobacteria bacterium YIM 96077]|uniref:Glucose-1-phosphate thymidylyltransferase n=1 Tax=Phytoactinopolyspora halophila TaxID=1981511 RepID=A0A329QJF8_9ACTN|nr:glucose-1-phosphate thymidylyltransferase RfbA [Phytoactinopolyspora halophila]AYY15309.1 glucose-1-phosphate thymidylyltransferase [Actinobacteria bacterium YIM 96077]RAW12051.1 glucose-1-phosphate thymidylyltransferase [Phytoactinopolyspora halophila]